MASISKLSIRGVRSFSPNDEEQVIGFCFPLTIIVGANGCGKTTIIESLKYAVTGSLPPGNKSGQSFVHDPKSIGQSSVKASIKLRFNNRGNHSMVVIRSMEVTQKKATANFKALDGILRTVDPNTGERTSLSHKCTELDKQIPHLMGVSKPILEHVVFCHQEDSSWPLQEGAVLKKRFDDIFDSTRYAKALEAIKGSRKEYASQVKDLKADLEGLKSHKHAASGFREEYEECKDKISGFDDEIDRCSKNIEEAKKKHNEAKKIQLAIEEFMSDLDMKRGEFEREEAVLAKQRELLGPDDLTGQYSMDELRGMLRELSDKHHGNQAVRALRDKEEEFEGIEKFLEGLRKKTNDLNSRKGKLEAEKDAHNVYV
jgi:DNA repair protein RAD50